MSTPQPEEDRHVSATAATGPSTDDLKKAFQAYMADPTTEIPEAVNLLQEKLDHHFSTDALTLPTNSIRYHQYLWVAYQRAFEEFLAAPGREHELTGIRCPSVADHWMLDMSLSRLLSKPSLAYVPPLFCPADYIVVPSGSGDQTTPVVKQGLITFKDAEGPGAFWLRYDEWREEMLIEAMTPTLERSEKILAGLREAAIRLSPFRGQVIEIIQVPGKPPIRFLDRPRHTTRDEVILPEGLLDQIERHSLGVVNAHEALRSNNRHLKRGLLLHGRPGTGKTHTIKYLISQMPHATIVVMSAARMYNLRLIREMADVIVPGVIVLDDLDLIGEDRELGFQRGALFELLATLDGIGEDKDLLFLLTTNRPNEIDPAVAARPGRVDQAIEVPLPDADCRRRLFALYTAKMQLEMNDAEMATFIERTDGVTASFIREAVRRATVATLDDEGSTDGVRIKGARVLTALDELLDPSNPLTPLLLGAEPKHAAPTVPIPTTRSY